MKRSNRSLLFAVLGTLALTALLLLAGSIGVFADSAVSLEHTDHADFTPLEETDTMPSAGAYYLASDVAVSAAWEVEADITLCLNGHTLDMDYHRLRVIDKLTVCDCGGNGKITGAPILNEGVIKVTGTMVLHSGRVESSYTASTYYAIHNYGGHLTVNGGSIVNADSFAIYAEYAYEQGATTVITGGQITGGRGIYNKFKCDLQISGSPQITGTADDAVTNYGTMTMAGGTLTSAEGYGLWNGYFGENTPGQAVITGGSLTGTLGIYNNTDCTLLISGNTTVTGTATDGIYTEADTTLSIGGSSVITGLRYGIYSGEGAVYLFDAPLISGGDADIYCFYDWRGDNLLYATDKAGTTPYTGGTLTVYPGEAVADDGEIVVRNVTSANQSSFLSANDAYTFVVGTGEDAGHLVLHEHELIAQHEAATGHWYQCNGCSFATQPVAEHLFDDYTGKCPCGLTGYLIWVGGVHVTDENKNDVLGDADDGATVTYDPEANTLILHDATIDTVWADEHGDTYQIYSTDDLCIRLVGTNILTDDTDEFLVSLGVEGTLTLESPLDGSLQITSPYIGIGAVDLTVISGTLQIDSDSYGIHIDNDLTVYGGRIDINSGTAIHAYKNIFINSGILNAEGNAYGLYANYTVTVNGGNVVADAANGDAITADAFVQNGGTVRAGSETAVVGLSSTEIAINGTFSAFGATAIEVRSAADWQIGSACTLLGHTEANVTVNDCSAVPTLAQGLSTSMYVMMLDTEYARAVFVTLSCNHTQMTSHSDEDVHWTECVNCDTIVSEKRIHVDSNSDKLCDVCERDVPSAYYDLYVMGIQVTDVNMHDILGDEDDGVTVSYDPETNTLTLNNADIRYTEGEDLYAIDVYDYNKSIALDLHIHLIGENSIYVAGYFAATGIYANDLKITAAPGGKLRLEATTVNDEDSMGIYTEAGLRFVSGEIFITARLAIYACEAIVADGFTVFGALLPNADELGEVTAADIPSPDSYGPPRVYSYFVGTPGAETPAGTLSLKHVHTPVADDGDCTTPVLCSVCGGTAVAGKSAHSFGTAYLSDESGHRRKCADCNKTESKTAHSGTDTCTVCGYADSAALENADPNAAPDGEEAPKEGLPTGAVVGIVIGAVPVAGIGGFSLFWFVIKKKSWRDLTKVFQKKP